MISEFKPGKVSQNTDAPEMYSEGKWHHTQSQWQIILDVEYENSREALGPKQHHILGPQACQISSALSAKLKVEPGVHSSEITTTGELRQVKNCP